MNNYVRGILAGFIATIVLSALMFMKGKMGMMPELDIIAMLASKMGGDAMMGWIAHFMIGSLGYGLAFAVIGDKLPGGNFVGKGIVLGIIGWLVMMIVMMPMMGGQMFLMNMGIMAPMMTLILHIIFGAVLGFSYRKLG